MKKMISYALFASMALFASCHQDETLEQATNAPGVLSFTTSLPNDGVQTKAEDTSVKRYIMQLYADYEGQMTAQYLNPAGTNDTTQKLLVQDNGTFTIDGAAINLAEGTTYTAVFWADYDEVNAAAPTYSANYLNCVQLNEGKEMAMAYCGTAQFTYGPDMDATQPVTLKRAVAQVNLNQSVAYTAEEAGQLSATYTRYVVYDALNACVYPTSDNWQTNVSTTSTLDIAAGDKAANSTLGSILVFASANEAINTEFSFAYGGETVGSVSNVPLQANYQTNISGNYFPSFNTSTTFRVATDDVWSGNLTPDAGGESGEDNEDEGETTTDTTAPSVSASCEVEGMSIHYSVTVTDETSLEGGWLEVYFYSQGWTQIGKTQYINYEEGTTTTCTMTGSLTATETGTYHIGFRAFDATKINNGYTDCKEIEVTVTE